MKILDLWCGRGNNEYWIYDKNNTTTGVDIEKKNISICKKKFPKHDFILVDWSKLPFKNESFDIIQSLDVLEHVNDLEAIIKEAIRVLKKWGKFIIEVPYWESEKILHKLNNKYFSQIHHMRVFKKWEMKNIMKNLWMNLSVEKKIKHFNHVWLEFYFKNWSSIINQNWNMNISKLLRLKFILLYLPYFVIYKIFKKRFDNRLPKSLYYEFIKK